MADDLAVDSRGKIDLNGSAETLSLMRHLSCLLLLWKRGRMESDEIEKERQSQRRC